MKYDLHYYSLGVMKHKGVVAVEFALICPVFFILIFSFIWIGRIFIVIHVTQNAVQLASRSIAVTDTWNPDGGTENLVKAKANAAAYIASQCALVGVVPQVTIADTKVTIIIPWSCFSIWPMAGNYTVSCQCPPELNP